MDFSNVPPSANQGTYGPYRRPPFLSAEQQNTDSTGSADSLMTQVPLPYHLSQNMSQYYLQQPAPWSTPQINLGSTMAPLSPYQAVSNLNPASGSFVPAGLPPPTYTNTPMTSSTQSFDSQSPYQSQGWFSNNGGVPSGDTSFSSGSTQPASQVDNMAYQASREHGAATALQFQQGFQGANSQYGFVLPSGPQLQQVNGQYAPAGPHQSHSYQQGSVHEGAQMRGPLTNPPEFRTYPNLPNGPHAYTNYGMSPFGGMGSNEYNPYTGAVGQMGSYAASSDASPAMSYAGNQNSPLQNFRAMVYNDGDGQDPDAPQKAFTDQAHVGITQAWGSIYGNGTAPIFNFDPGTANGNGSAYNGVGKLYNPQQGTSYGGSSNKSQAQNHYNKGKKSTSSQNNSRPASRANAAKNIQGNLRNPQGSSVIERVADPRKGANNTVISSEQRAVSTSRSSHHSVVSDDTKVNSNGAFTPAKRALDGECTKSEPRIVGTPQLRSRGGQSIPDESATEPGRNKQAVTDWLDETPTNHMQSLTLEEATETIKRHQRSPPKMPSLFTHSGSCVTTSLKPINDSDPFITRRPPIAAIGPYRGSLLGQHGGISRPLAILTQGGTAKPSIEEALDPRNLPFVEYCRKAKADEWGVIRIKNIPYSVNRPEVLAFLGRNARIVAENDNEPVHIIMERVTSKTLDCYVEFVSFSEAVAAVQRYETNRSGGRGGRLGQRHVEVELSSQEQLMHDLFPKAKNVIWHGSRPEIRPANPHDPYNSGFQGFVTREELVMLVKHVEAPQRSPFSKECPQRPFECLISTLMKYPWYMVDSITIQDRALLHKATVDLLTLLVDRVNSNSEDVNLTNMLLKRVWKAALKCPGFTPVMKDDIVYIAGIDEQTAKEHGVAPFASGWRDIYTIGPKVDAPHDLILWYIAIIREATEARKPQLSLAEQAASTEVVKENRLFGDLDRYINHNKNVLHKMTLGQVAKAEWAAFERILRMALTPALEG